MNVAFICLLSVSLWMAHLMDLVGLEKSIRFHVCPSCRLMNFCIFLQLGQL